MFSWLGTDDRRKKDPEVFQTVSEGLKKLYKTKLLPLEESYKFHEFHSPALEDADFDNKPMVLLVGQYSTGKTSFIRWVWHNTHLEMSTTKTPHTPNLNLSFNSSGLFSTFIKRYREQKQDKQEPHTNKSEPPTVKLVNMEATLLYPHMDDVVWYK